MASTPVAVPRGILPVAEVRAVLRRLFPVSRRMSSASLLDHRSSCSATLTPPVCRASAILRALTQPGPSLPSALKGSPITTSETLRSAQRARRAVTSEASEVMGMVA